MTRWPILAEKWAGNRGRGRRSRSWEGKSGESGRTEPGEGRGKEWEEQEKRRQRNRGGGGQVIRRGKSQGKCGWGDKRKGLGGSHGMRNARNRKTGIEIGVFPSFTPIAVVNILTKAIREKRLIWLTTRVTVQ